LFFRVKIQYKFAIVYNDMKMFYVVINEAFLTDDTILRLAERINW